jgi:GTP-binding protein
VVFVSALSGEGLPRLMQAVVTALAGAPAPPVPARARTTKLAARPSPDLVVEQRPWGFLVRGERVERLVERTDLDSEPALERFQSLLDKLGVSAALEAAGVKPGDTVRIAEAEFEYQP